jgi:hypothetical protein
MTVAESDLHFYFDPVCQFAWMTSKWVRQVSAARDYRVQWRLISLRLINEHVDYEAHFPPEYEASHNAGLRMLRVAARARAEHGPAAVDRLQAAYGVDISTGRPGGTRPNGPPRSVNRRRSGPRCGGPGFPRRWSRPCTTAFGTNRSEPRPGTPAN